MENSGEMLCSAISANDIELAKSLIEQGADIRYENKYSWTPWRIAVKHKRTEIISLLIEKGIFIDEKDSIGWTALHHAVPDNPEYCDWLIRNGANVNSIDNHGESILIRAIIGCRLFHDKEDPDKLNVIKNLISHGADVNYENIKGFELGLASALLVSVGCHFSITELLITHGADIHIKGNQGETLLMMAAYNGNLELVKYLVERNVETNIQDNEGNTSLMYLARSHTEKFLEIADALFSGGADSTIRNKKGETAAQVYCEFISNYGFFKPSHSEALSRRAQ
jgi:ankyrin repeat protein